MTFSEYKRERSQRRIDSAFREVKNNMLRMKLPTFEVDRVGYNEWDTKRNTWRKDKA